MDKGNHSSVKRRVTVPFASKSLTARGGLTLVLNSYAGVDVIVV
ncbi:MAG: hypothetical protein ACXV5T_04570 [Halobacteriota archaeon]